MARVWHKCHFAPLLRGAWRHFWAGDKAQFGTFSTRLLINRSFLQSAAHTSSLDFTPDLSDTMENFAFNYGFTANSNGTGITHQPLQSAPLWRPWAGANGTVTHMPSLHPTFLTAPFTHRQTLTYVFSFFPRLFWPKSKCFDYLYQDAEQLLRNYPVQATICPYGDSSSDEESGDEQDEDEEEEEEMAKMGLN
uniref:Ripply transcriptional repressor 2 n=1 Tax=Periophthalmus magnuspinnatus TaxID=409849 RepID=A0A3B4A659_9GOBI